MIATSGGAVGNDATYWICGPFCASTYVAVRTADVVLIGEDEDDMARVWGDAADDVLIIGHRFLHATSWYG